MSLDRVARPASSGGHRSDRSLWLIVAVLLPFLLTQVLPEQTTMSPVSGSTAAWEDAENDASDNLDQGYRTATVTDSCVEPAPTRLPEAGVVVARHPFSRQMSCLVAAS